MNNENEVVRYKICANSKCKQTNPQSIRNFSIRDGGKARNTCKCCKAEYDHRYRIKNAEKIRANDAVRGKSVARKESQKRYRERHKDEIRKKAKIRAEKYKIKRNKQLAERKKKDPNYRIACNIRNRLRMALIGRQKVGSAVNDLGCSIEQFVFWLEQKFYDNKTTGEPMTWNNYGSKWHIDHVRPLASFDLTDMAQFLHACHYSNLQPMWAKENLEKGDKW